MRFPNIWWQNYHHYDIYYAVIYMHKVEMETDKQRNWSHVPNLPQSFGVTATARWQLATAVVQRVLIFRHLSYNLTASSVHHRSGLQIDGRKSICMGLLSNALRFQSRASDANNPVSFIKNKSCLSNIIADAWKLYYP